MNRFPAWVIKQIGLHQLLERNQEEYKRLNTCTAYCDQNGFRNRKYVYKGFNESEKESKKYNLRTHIQETKLKYQGKLSTIQLRNFLSSTAI